MDRIVKAKVAEVRVGKIKIQGLKLPNGKYAIAVPQIATLFCTSINTMSRDLKRLMGKDFHPSKVKTELGNQLINVVSLEEFNLICLKLALKGNKYAADFMLSLNGLSLTELFNDAFGIVNTPETRQIFIEEKSLLRLREELTLVHGGFQAKCVNLKYCARRVHDFATKHLVGRTATESIIQVPINPEFIEYEKYSKEFIGINHVNEDEVKFLESLINFKKHFSNKRPRIKEDWKDYTNRILNMV